MMGARGEQANGREGGVDHIHPGLSQLRDQRGFACDRASEGGGGEVDHELGRDRCDQQDRAGIAGFDLRDREHRRWSDREPGVGGLHQDAAYRGRTPDQVRQPGQDERGRDRDRNDRRRHREQERDEGHLRRDRESERGVEANLDRERQDEQTHDRRHDGKRVRSLDRPQPRCRSDEPRQRQRLSESLTIREAEPAAAQGVLEQLLIFEIGLHRHVDEMIGRARGRLDAIGRMWVQRLSRGRRAAQWCRSEIDAPAVKALKRANPVRTGDAKQEVSGSRRWLGCQHHHGR